MKNQKDLITGGLIVVSLWADDILLTAHFYRDVLGLPMVPHHGERPTFSLGRGTLLVICHGESGPDRAAGDEHWPKIALRVNDLDAAIERLSAYRIQLPWGIEHGQGARYVMFYDPAGNLIELAELGKAEM